MVQWQKIEAQSFLISNRVQIQKIMIKSLKFARQIFFGLITLDWILDWFIFDVDNVRFVRGSGKRGKCLEKEGNGVVFEWGEWGELPWQFNGNLCFDDAIGLYSSRRQYTVTSVL